MAAELHASRGADRERATRLNAQQKCVSLCGAAKDGATGVGRAVLRSSGPLLASHSVGRSRASRCCL